MVLSLASLFQYHKGTPQVSERIMSEALTSMISGEPEPKIGRGVQTLYHTQKSFNRILQQGHGVSAETGRELC